MPNVHARKHDILPIPLKCDFVVFEPAVQTQSVKSKSVLRLNGIKWVKFPSGQTPLFKLIRYHLLTFVKHVLAPQDDFGMQKKTW